MKNKNLALIAVLFTISIAMAFANGPTPPVYIDTDQIIDGAVDIIKTTGIADTSLSNVVPATGRDALELGTMAVVNSPVPVANGGHGKTTAAEGLAALGGASLNGSSAVDFSVRNGTVGGTLGVTGHATLTTASATVADIGSLMIREYTVKVTNGTPVDITTPNKIAGELLITSATIPGAGNYSFVSTIVNADAVTSAFETSVTVLMPSNTTIRIGHSAGSVGVTEHTFKVKMIGAWY